MPGPSQQEHAGFTFRFSGAMVASLAFMAGLLLSHSLNTVSIAMWLILAGIGAVISPFAPPRVARLSLVLAVAAMGAAWHDVRLERRPADSLAVLIKSDEPTLVRVAGVVESEPVQGSAQYGPFARFAYQGVATRFTLGARHLIGRDGEHLAVSGRLWVRVDEAVYQLRAGDRVVVMGLFHHLAPAANPGEPPQDRAARQFHVAGRLTVSSRANVQHADRGPKRLDSRLLHTFDAGRAGFRRQAARWLYAGAFDAEDLRTRRDQSLVSALVIGERSGEAREITAAFRRVGLAHLLSISGLHLAILAAVVALIARFFTSSRRLEMLIVALVVLVYLFLVPARIPVVRASIMVLGFVAAEMAGRRYDRLSVLALIALALLVWRPLELWSPGFQLSFGIVAGLIALGEPFRRRLFDERPSPDTVRPGERLIEGVKTAFAGSLLAWLLATPLVAFHFQILCPLAPILGLLALPLAGGVLVLGYAKILTGALLPSLGQILGPFLALSAALLAELVVQIDRLPLASIRTPHLSHRWAFFATAAVVYLVVHPRTRRRAALALVAAVAVWLWIGSAPQRELRRSPDAVVRLDMLAVGEGACIVIRTPGAAYLWDCGSLNLLSVGERIILPALGALGVRRLDGVFITHPEMDHYAAAPTLLEAMPIRRFFVTPDFYETVHAEPLGPVALLQSELDRHGVSTLALTEGWELELPGSGGVRLTVLHPPAQEAYERPNEGSLVMRIDASGRTILLTGDLERVGLADVRARYPDLRCDVLEIPHHGSVTRETTAFVAALDPAVVLQSTGPRRDPAGFGELTQGRRWYATAHNGAAWVEITRHGEIRAGAMRD